MKMIDPATGTVKLAQNRTLTCGHKLEDFLKLGVSNQPLMQSEPWTVFKVELTDSHDAPFAALVKFYEDRLREIELFAKGAPDDDVDDTAKLYDRWLEQELGEGPYSYDWGRIDTSIDRKAGNASVVIRYGGILY